MKHSFNGSVRNFPFKWAEMKHEAACQTVNGHCGERRRPFFFRLLINIDWVRFLCWPKTIFFFVHLKRFPHRHRAHRAVNKNDRHRHRTVKTTFIQFSLLSVRATRKVNSIIALSVRSLIYLPVQLRWIIHTSVGLTTGSNAPILLGHDALQRAALGRASPDKKSLNIH